MDFLSALASHTANALQNAILYEEARGKRELGVLLEASRLFSSSLNMKDIIHKMAELATNAVRADLAVVVVLDKVHDRLHYVTYHTEGRRSAAVARHVMEALNLKDYEGQDAVRNISWYTGLFIDVLCSRDQFQCHT
jgi:GAF domain-containing protein